MNHGGCGQFSQQQQQQQVFQQQRLLQQYLQQRQCLQQQYLPQQQYCQQLPARDFSGPEDFVGNQARYSFLVHSAMLHNRQPAYHQAVASVANQRNISGGKYSLALHAFVPRDMPNTH
jgi:hypothetical protein